MKIGIDISQVAYEGTGVGRFTAGLIRSILAHDTENTWTFLFSALRGKIDSQLLHSIRSSRHRFVRLPFSPAMVSRIWNTWHILPVDLLTGKLDYFICSDWTEPPARCKKATIVHDFAYLEYPETVHASILTTQKKRMEWVKKESSLIITPSQATASDVEKYLSIPRSKIQPLYSGVEIMTPSPEHLKQVKHTYTISKPFILSVGKIEPRKNIERLIESFSSLNKKDWDLIIVGPQGWGNTKETNSHPSIRFTGYVPESDLHALYELCSFFVLPSLLEGFGYPIIEAMMHHKAVAASDNSSMKELVEGRGILFNPHSQFDISASLLTLMDDSKIRAECAEKGYEYSKEFTWKRYYEGLMKAIARSL